MNLLILNAGSSSIKYKVYQFNDNNLAPMLSGLIEGIGETEGSWHQLRENKKSSTHHFKSHEQAFAALANNLAIELKDYPIDGIGHRVVHGGDRYFQPTLITPEVLTEIKALATLAPIHNPINATGIEFALHYYPKALHVAIFDSGFHHTMPEFVRQYPLDSHIAERYRIKRYGFHGINHEYVARQAAAYLNKPLESCNFITLHLGNGASACLIKAGKSSDTSMGMTPLAGLMMGTRCGDIDPAIVLYLQQQGLSTSDIDKILNKQSGLKGIAEDNDMRKLLARAEQNDKQAELAIDMYVYSIQKMIGAYLSQLSTLDALIFTGGVGENASLIRERVISPLKHLGFDLDVGLNNASQNNDCFAISTSTPILVIRGDEEHLMVKKVIALCDIRS